jgi:hypothetical protein
MYCRCDPGPCPICGAAHTACTGTTPAPVVQMTPARDALSTAGETNDRAVRAPGDVPSHTESPPFTTATYRRKRRGGST